MCISFNDHKEQSTNRCDRYTPMWEMPLHSTKSAKVPLVLAMQPHSLVNSTKLGWMSL